VVLFNTSLGQILKIFGWIFVSLRAILKPLFNSIFNHINSYFTIIRQYYRDDWENKSKGFTFSNNGVVILFRLYAHILNYLKFKGIDIESAKRNY